MHSYLWALGTERTWCQAIGEGYVSLRGGPASRKKLRSLQIRVKAPSVCQMAAFYTFKICSD